MKYFTHTYIGLNSRLRGCPKPVEKGREQVCIDMTLR